MTCCCEITDLPICLEKKEFIDFRFTTTNKIKSFIHFPGGDTSTRPVQASLRSHIIDISFAWKLWPLQHNLVRMFHCLSGTQYNAWALCDFFICKVQVYWSVVSKRRNHCYKTPPIPRVNRVSKFIFKDSKAHKRHSLNKKIQRLLLLLLAPKQIKWQNPVGLSQHWMMDNWSSPIRNQSLMIQYLKSCFGSVYAWMVLFALKAK